MITPRNLAIGQQICICVVEKTVFVMSLHQTGSGLGYLESDAAEFKESCRIGNESGLQFFLNNSIKLGSGVEHFF